MSATEVATEPFLPWWVLYPILAILLGALAFWVSKRGKEPPGVAYVCFSLLGGALVFMLSVDTGWIRRVPRFLWAGAEYGLIQEKVARIEQSVAAFETQEFSINEVTVESLGINAEEKREHFRTTMMLQYPAVPASVFLWHGAAWPVSPHLIEVDGRIVRLTTGYKPELVPGKFYVRYFREPVIKAQAESRATASGSAEPTVR